MRQQEASLWPFVAALGAAAVVAAVVVLVAVRSSGIDEPGGPPAPLPILVAAPVDDGVVRAVTDDHCAPALHADVRVRAEAVELRVIGKDAPGGCTAVVTYECFEVRLPAAAAGRPLIAVPLIPRSAGVSETALVRRYASGECSPLRVA